MVFQSLHNFRDVGGCATIDGRTVATARLYRSDMLIKLTADEMPRFEQLGIRTVIDLRRPHEVAALGRIPDAASRRYVNISPEHTLWPDLDADETVGAERYLADRYLELADTGRDGIGQVLAMIADDAGAPTVVHCFAGKDRTGVVVALTLALLGVGDGAIGDDYARSDHWVRNAAPSDIPHHWTLAPRAAIIRFLASLRAEYGSFEAYASLAGVGPAEIRALRRHLLR
jgi:protein-tyrosine phosphatase